ncbi:hypothetical protein AVEN_246242-1 [Araneus ventricosus]|uniref:Uncharacterized protein n=1 Tax=Araneus ventricosus TaxID=182803 RepID=A0A4Y2LAP8_ARAVE|nr:hypothetical protein AVEN_246242-1 [Araneus ventricosus]
MRLGYQPIDTPGTEMYHPSNGTPRTANTWRRCAPEGSRRRGKLPQVPAPDGITEVIATPASSDADAIAANILTPPPTGEDGIDSYLRPFTESILTLLSEEASDDNFHLFCEFVGNAIEEVRIKAFVQELGKKM